MTRKKSRDVTPEEKAYLEWRDGLLADPDVQAIYAEEVEKSELWFQLVTARQEAGLTQAEMARRIGVSQALVARIEQDGYDRYTLNTLRRFVKNWERGSR